MRRKLVTILVALVSVPLAASASLLLIIQASAREHVSQDSLVLGHPSSFTGLKNRGLETDLVVDGIRFGGKSVGSQMPGEQIIDWYSASGVTFRQELWVEKSAVLAFRDYHLKSPKPNFRRKFGGALVKSVDVPGESSADSADLFCGNVGKSKTSQLEDCQVWGYWARYGQYLVYLELAGMKEPANAIREVIEAVDARVPSS